MKSGLRDGVSAVCLAVVLGQGACGAGASMAEGSTQEAEDSSTQGSAEGSTQVLSEGTSLAESSSGGEIGEVCLIDFEPTGEAKCGTVAGRTLCFHESQPLEIAGAGRVGHVADINKDGSDDLVIQEYNPEKTWLLRSNTECGRFGGFVEAEVFSQDTTIPRSVLSMDANEDGLSDLMMLTIRGVGQGDTLLFLGEENSGFSGGPLPDFTMDAVDLVFDINGDGHVDVVGRASFDIMIYLGDGSGGFSAGPKIVIDGAAEVKTGIVDFDGNGRVDIVTARSIMIDDFSVAYDVVICFGDEQGLFSKQVAFPLNVESFFPYDLAIDDFNRDGHPDIAVHGAVYYGDGLGIKSTESIPGLLDAISAADIDGDGLTDLVSSLDIFINTGESFVGGFSEGSFSLELRPGEFNGDGVVDISTIRYGKDGDADSVVIYTRVVD